jgi:hypothetical protein
MVIDCVVDEYKFGKHGFFVYFESGIGIDDQLQVFWEHKMASGEWSEPLWIRSFYFEEVNNSRHIRNFCRKFAKDGAYRKQSLALELPWFTIGALLERNIVDAYSQTSKVGVLDLFPSPEEFHHFLRRNYTTIMASPEYQRLCALDSNRRVTEDNTDVEIAPAVQEFVSGSGLTCGRSCQGVSGVFTFKDVPLWVPGSHRFLAWIDIKSPSQETLEAIKELVVRYPAVQLGSWFSKTGLQSTGDNLSFRKEALELARALAAGRGRG